MMEAARPRINLQPLGTRQWPILRHIQPRTSTMNSIRVDLAAVVALVIVVLAVLLHRQVLLMVVVDSEAQPQLVNIII